MTIQLSLCLVLVAASLAHPTEVGFTREFDLIYHRQDGFALTMERVAPVEQGNAAAVVLVMSGGWVSNHDFTQPHDANQLPNIFKNQAAELLKRGYTLFYVVHGTQPKFTIREIHDQISAAVRHIRHHAPDYGVDPNHVGIMGGSAGGHLALMQGTSGEPGVENPTSAAEQSSKVQAVVAYFPPTDFRNYGSADGVFDSHVRQVIPDGINPFMQALDYLEYDLKNRRLTKVTDRERIVAHYQYISPRYHVTKDDTPSLLLHGDLDQMVPMQQSN
ncbi:MAG: alpha/beta hydrolase fold domain-containing protein [Gammaproteobacteria bacterium]|nr:alpha/beta hydrolase fold domain-containing protein [Gammaproteobacteria bacterium]